MSSLNPYEPPPIPEPDSLRARPVSSDDEYDGPSFRSPLAWGMVCMVLLGLEILGTTAESYRLLHLYWLQLESIPSDQLDTEAIASWSSWASASYIFGLFLSLTASAWVIAWMFRTHRNLEPLRYRELDSKHIWAILCWLVPVLNLFCPFLVMREIWWRSFPEAKDTADSAPATHLVFWWWLLRVAAVGTAYLTHLFSSYVSWPQYYTFLRIFFLSSGFEVVSAILAILIIYRISRWQMERYQRIQEAACR